MECTRYTPYAGEIAHTHFIVAYIAPVRNKKVLVKGITTATHSGIPIHALEVSMIHANTAIHNINDDTIYFEKNREKRVDFQVKNAVRTFNQTD
jgi:hypothetical protein